MQGVIMVIIFVVWVFFLLFDFTSDWSQNNEHSTNNKKYS